MVRPDHTPEASEYTNHPCRGVCGGYLHGCCGEMDSSGDSEMHRICHSCLGEVAEQSKSASDGKRCATGDVGTSNKKKQKTRTRLTLRQKGEVLDLVDKNIAHDEISLKYSCAERTVKNVARHREKIRNQLASCVGREGHKSIRPLMYPEVGARTYPFFS